eukprot:586565-Prymnesium_polylepis.1
MAAAEPSWPHLGGTRARPPAATDAASTDGDAASRLRVACVGGPEGDGPALGEEEHPPRREAPIADGFHGLVHEHDA